MTMKKLTFFILISICSLSVLRAGDTTWVQTFTFGSPQNDTFAFPSDTIRYEKIYLYYTLKCNPAQSPACGEWDYLTYIYLYKDSLRYELGRYITPYGIGLDFGTGRTWVYDVTDFRPLLTGDVHLSAGNWQELLDMKFMFVEGTPPRDVLDIKNIWNGGHNYNASIETNFLVPKTFP